MGGKPRQQERVLVKGDWRLEMGRGKGSLVSRSRGEPTHVWRVRLYRGLALENEVQGVDFATATKYFQGTAEGLR